MILHLITNDKFTKPIINFINTNFDNNIHYFFVPGACQELTVERNVVRAGKNAKTLFYLIKYLYKSKGIILHNMFNKWFVLFLALQPWLLKKTIWVVWGGDLYCYRERRKSFKRAIYEFIRRFMIRRLYGIATLVKGDYKLAKEWYKTNSKYFIAKYVNDEQTECIKKIVSNRDNNINNTFKEVRIVLGNSATRSNRHFEVLDLLKKYKDENIKIFCPLSYGDTSYALEVKEYGNHIFQDKFIALDEFLPINKYVEFLDTVHIGIFNNDRQQALGNIFSLLHLGKKVYLRKGTTMWDEINDELQFVVYDVKKICHESFEAFTHMSKTLSKKNIDIGQKLSSSAYVKSIWTTIFSDILNKY